MKISGAIARLRTLAEKLLLARRWGAHANSHCGEGREWCNPAFDARTMSAKGSLMSA